MGAQTGKKQSRSPAYPRPGGHSITSLTAISYEGCSDKPKTLSALSAIVTSWKYYCRNYTNFPIRTREAFRSAQAEARDITRTSTTSLVPARPGYENRAVQASIV